MTTRFQLLPKNSLIVHFFFQLSTLLFSDGLCFLDGSHWGLRTKTLGYSRECTSVKPWLSSPFLSIRSLRLSLRGSLRSNVPDSPPATRSTHLGDEKMAIFVGRRMAVLQILTIPTLAWSSDMFSTVSLEVFGQTPPTQSLPTWVEPVYSALGLTRLSRPGPVRIPRISLYRPFAVLLMRSSYEVADELDFVPMDRFQREFFLLRADEWEQYRAENDAKQGDLSDALYFDFISAAQYATITKLMREDATSVFEEKVGAEGLSQLVQRDPSVSNSMLPSLLLERVGDRLLDGLYANFSGPSFYTQPPPPCPPPSAGGAGADSLVAGLAQLCALLAENGSAREIDVLDAGEVGGKDYVQVTVLSLVAKHRSAALMKAGARALVRAQSPCSGHCCVSA